MKKLGKIFALVVLFAMLATTIVNASASDDLLNELSKTYKVGGKEVSISATDKVKVERYLADNPVTEEQKNTIIAKVNAIVAIMDAEGVSDPAKLSKTKKTEAINLAKEAASAVDLKLVVDTNKNTINVYDEDGKLIESAKIENGKLAYTGSNANEALLNELSKTYKVGGKEVSISATDKVKVERYLADNPVTEEQKDTIIAKVNAIVAIMDAEGVSDPAKLSETKKTEAINLAKEAASAIDLKLVVDTNKNTINVYNENGKLIESAKIENGKLAYTGNNSYLYVVAPIVALIAVATVVIARKKVNA